jgi:hypothetical protein
MEAWIIHDYCLSGHKGLSQYLLGIGIEYFFAAIALKNKWRCNFLTNELCYDVKPTTSSGFFKTVYSLAFKLPAIGVFIIII